MAAITLNHDIPVRDYRTEAPHVVVTSAGELVSSHYTADAATESARKGRRRHILVRHRGAWHLWKTYAGGHLVRPTPIDKPARTGA